MSKVRVVGTPEQVSCLRRVSERRRPLGPPYNDSEHDSHCLLVPTKRQTPRCKPDQGGHLCVHILELFFRLASHSLQHARPVVALASTPRKEAQALARVRARVEAPIRGGARGVLSPVLEGARARARAGPALEPAPARGRARGPALEPAPVRGRAREGAPARGRGRGPALDQAPVPPRTPGSTAPRPSRPVARRTAAQILRAPRAPKRGHSGRIRSVPVHA
jgi:hypothetical protein